jgi:hypothetical protein
MIQKALIKGTGKVTKPPSPFSTSSSYPFTNSLSEWFQHIQVGMWLAGYLIPSSNFQSKKSNYANP